HAGPRLAGAPRPEPAPGPRRAHALRRDRAARGLARLRPHGDRDERQPLLDRRSRPRAGALLAPGVVLPRRHRGRGRRRLRAARARADRGRPARRRRPPGGDGDAEHRHRCDVQADRQPRRARRRLHAAGAQRRARDLAVQGRLRVLRAERRGGPHPGARRHGRVHGRARHGLGGAQGAGLEDLQPQPADTGRGGHVTDLFAGTTILEFGGGAAGPVATRYFADHGATVIRVESRRRPDFLRTLRLTPDSPGGLDGAHHFAVLNANKLSVALDLSRPEGVAVARRLALWADAVAENFAPGAMVKWGLDYAALVRERPDLVMISTCLKGQTRPERNYPGFGGQGSALAG